MAVTVWEYFDADNCFHCCVGNPPVGAWPLAGTKSTRLRRACSARHHGGPDCPRSTGSRRRAACADAPGDAPSQCAGCGDTIVHPPAKTTTQNMTKTRKKNQEEENGAHDAAAGDREIDRQRHGSLTLSQRGAEGISAIYSVLRGLDARRRLFFRQFAGMQHDRKQWAGFSGRHALGLDPRDHAWAA